MYPPHPKIWCTDFLRYSKVSSSNSRIHPETLQISEYHENLPNDSDPNYSWAGLQKRLKDNDSKKKKKNLKSLTASLSLPEEIGFAQSRDVVAEVAQSLHGGRIRLRMSSVAVELEIFPCERFPACGWLQVIGISLHQIVKMDIVESLSLCLCIVFFGWCRPSETQCRI